MTPEELRSFALNAKAYDLALCDLGVYPAAFVGKYAKRNSFQEGFNRAVLEISNDACKIHDWLITQPEELQDEILRETKSVHIDENGKVNAYAMEDE